MEKNRSEEITQTKVQRETKMVSKELSERNIRKRKKGLTYVLTGIFEEKEITD